MNRVEQTEAEAQIKRAEWARDRWVALFGEMNAEFGSCPFCGWQTRSQFARRWLYLLRHFEAKHPDIVQVGAVGIHKEARAV